MDGLRSLSNQPDLKRPTIQEPLKIQTQMVFDLYKQGLHQEALDRTLELLVEFPNSVTLYNILGAANSVSKLDQATEAYKKALQSILIFTKPIVTWVML